ncbi:MAG: hypothetical protein CVT67_02900 [Actinobacteria bacterium HGW-Actinobacteria-7]|jgi:hypothetical protein|nr:MAG: hypothetical protein CVT67_02900 [Actinobacteria bacterium HGW-Actinobacteria-7]
MANSLDRDIEFCEVVLGREFYPDDEPSWDTEENRTVFCYGGFGSSSEANGSALFVRDHKGNTWQARGHMVERLVREVPEDERAITYIVTVMSPAGVETYEVSAITPNSANTEVLKMKGWEHLTHTLGDKADGVLIDIEGINHILSAKMKGVS